MVWFKHISPNEIKITYTKMYLSWKKLYILLLEILYKQVSMIF